MRVDIAVHQVATSYAESLIGPSDEDPNPDAVDPQDAIGGIYGKVLDGTSWMDRYDDHPLAITGTEVAFRRAGIHALAQRRWVPWGNVTGYEPEQEGRLAAEAAIAAQRGRESSPHTFDAELGATYIANVEPYPQFWPHRGLASSNKANAFLRSFVEHGGEHLWMWIDAREWQLDITRGISFGIWWDWQVVDRVLPEVYWTDFGINYRTAVDRAIYQLGTYGVHPDQIFPTFPGNAYPSAMTEAIEYARERGLGRPNIWQRLNLRPLTAKAIARLDDPWAETPPAPPRPDPETVRAYQVMRIEMERLRRVAAGDTRAALDLLGEKLGIGG